MRPLSQIGQMMRLTIVVPFYLSAVLSALVLIQSVVQSRKKTIWFCCVMNTVISYLFAVLTKEVIQSGMENRQMVGLSVSFGHLPACFVQVLAILTSILTVLFLRGIVKWQHSHISKRSIKIGMDMMPVGLCCYYENGRMRLVNRKMNEISRALVGSLEENASLLWQTLHSGNLLEGNELLSQGEEPMVRLSDGTVYVFCRRHIELDGNMLWELSATDITEEYEKSQLLEQEQKHMEEVNQHLKEFSQQVTQVTIEKEILAAKLRIHDELGHALIATRRYLCTDSTDHESLLALWRQNISLLKHEEAEAILDDYESIWQIAESCGIFINLNGNLPTDSKSKNIISSAISECVTNTYKHAHGDELLIKVVDGQDYVHVSIVNTGEAPKIEIRETGGLMNLRRTVEAAGGVMQIESLPRFTLQLSLLKEGVVS